MVLVALPGGAAGAFTFAELAAARERAQAMGFNSPPPDERPTTEKLVTSQGLAELLGCNDTTVEAMARDARIPSVRLGKLLRFQPRAVLAALKARRE